MENSLDAMVFAVLDTVKPENMTNTNITEELVQYHINNIRAFLIRQDFDKGYSVDSSIVQSLGCLGLSEVDRSECCALPTGCKILRTSLQIPKTIDTHQRNLITRVGPVNRFEKPWQRVEYERVPFESLNKYTRGLIKWFTKDDSNYIYILAPEGDLLANSLEYISVDGVFEKPTDLVSFTNCTTGTTCFSSKGTYPVKASMIPTIIEMVIKRFVAMQAQSPIDSTNDNATNPQITVTK